MRKRTTRPAASEVAPVRTSPAYIQDRPRIVYEDDLRLVRYGWGPTIRAICLRISAAAAHRIASRPQRSTGRSAAKAGMLAVAGAAAVYAKSRGLL